MVAGSEYIVTDVVPCPISFYLPHCLAFIKFEGLKLISLPGSGDGGHHSCNAI